MAPRRTNTRNTGPILGGAAPPRAPRHTPLPFVLDPGRSWAIEEGRGSVSRGKGAGTMRVPLDGSDRSRGIRIHEMAHVKWSPSIMRGVEQIPFPTVNAVEDCRVHKRLHEIGYQMPAVLSHENYLDMQDANEEGRLPSIEAGRLYVASIGTDDALGVRNALADAGLMWVVRACDHLYETYMRPRRPAWNKTVEMCEAFEELFRAPDDPDSFEQHMRDLDQAAAPHMSEGSGKWGVMTIETPPLVQRMPRGMRAPSRRASDTGAVPRYWHRAPTDGRIFAGRGKRPCGGSVLIDQSGSMSLTPEDVLDLVAMFPGVRIGTYAGDGGKGRLRILADRGMRVSDADCYLPEGGNTVDGPALDWLAQQPGPRVWVSDGLVTGAHEGCTPALLTDTARKLAAGRIRRVGDVRDLLTQEGT